LSVTHTANHGFANQSKILYLLGGEQNPVELITIFFRLQLSHSWSLFTNVFSKLICLSHLWIFACSWSIVFATPTPEDI